MSKKHLSQSRSLDKVVQFTQRRISWQRLQIHKKILFLHLEQPEGIHIQSSDSINNLNESIFNQVNYRKVTLKNGFIIRHRLKLGANSIIEIKKLLFKRFHNFHLQSSKVIYNLIFQTLEIKNNQLKRCNPKEKLEYLESMHLFFFCYGISLVPIYKKFDDRLKWIMKLNVRRSTGRKTIRL